MRIVELRKDLSGLKDRQVAYCPQKSDLHLKGYGCGSTDFVVPPMSDKEVSDVAVKVREVNAPVAGDYLDIVKLVECQLYTKKLKFLLEIRSVDEMGSADGLTSYNGRHIIIREDSYLAACNGGLDGRFVMAHELGHHYLHASSTPPMPRASQKKVPVTCSSEYQADCFARCIIAPLSRIDENDDKITVANRFGLTEAEAQKHITLWKKVRKDSGPKLLL